MKVNLFYLVHTLKATGDVNIKESVIGAVAGPGATIGTASAISQLQPSSESQGMSHA